MAVMLAAPGVEGNLAFGSEIDDPVGFGDVVEVEDVFKCEESCWPNYLPYCRSVHIPLRLPKLPQRRDVNDQKFGVPTHDGNQGRAAFELLA